MTRKTKNAKDMTWKDWYQLPCPRNYSSAFDSFVLGPHKPSGFYVAPIRDGTLMCRVQVEESACLETDGDDLLIECLPCGLIRISPNHKQQFRLVRGHTLFSIEIDRRKG